MGVLEVVEIGPKMETSFSAEDSKAHWCFLCYNRILIMVNNVVILGLVLNLIASFLIAYGRIFRSKKIIQKESRTDKERNLEEERQRLRNSHSSDWSGCYGRRICHSDYRQYFLSIDDYDCPSKIRIDPLLDSCKCYSL
jgi:hypothetical protein